MLHIKIKVTISKHKLGMVYCHYNILRILMIFQIRIVHIGKMLGGVYKDYFSWSHLKRLMNRSNNLV